MFIPSKIFQMLSGIGSGSQIICSDGGKTILSWIFGENYLTRSHLNIEHRIRRHSEYGCVPNKTLLGRLFHHIYFALLSLFDHDEGIEKIIKRDFKFKQGMRCQFVMIRKIDIQIWEHFVKCARSCISCAVEHLRKWIWLCLDFDLP